jgi:hypothetical protein
MIILQLFINKNDNYIEDISVPYILRGRGSLKLGLKRALLHGGHMSRVSL